MPSPTSSLATLRPDLAGSFMEFNLQMDAQGFIAHRVLPVIDVAKASGTFGTIPIEQLLQSRDTKRAPGSGYNRSSYTFTPATFATEEHGAEEAVDDNAATMYREYFDAEMIATQRAFSAVLRNHEQRVADALFNATTWTGASLTTAVTNEWDDLTNATPLTDVETALQTIYDNSGLWANALIINRKTFRNLRRCSQIVDQAKQQGFMDVRAGTISEQQLALVFDIPNIIVAGGTKNTAAEGQSATPGQIWSGEYAMIARIPMTNDIQEPGVGRTFHWSEDGSDIDGRVESYRDETVRGDVIRVRHQVDEKILYVQAAHLLSNIVT